MRSNVKSKKTGSIPIRGITRNRLMLLFIAVVGLVLACWAWRTRNGAVGNVQAESDENRIRSQAVGAMTRAGVGRPAVDPTDSSPSGPAESVVVEPLDRMARIEMGAGPEYQELSRILEDAGVDPGTLRLVLPRIYGDLQRLRQFSEFIGVYRDRLNNTNLDWLREVSDDDRASYFEMQRKSLATLERIQQNYQADARRRITDEAGIPEAETVEKILAARAGASLPDVGQPR